MDSTQSSSTPVVVVCLSAEGGGRANCGFNIGDICVDRTKTFNRANLNMQQVQIRKFNSDGSKAIVHYTHCPAGMVFAIDVLLLNSVDSDGFLRPSPYYVAIEEEVYNSSSSKRSSSSSTATTTTTDQEEERGATAGNNKKSRKD